MFRTLTDQEKEEFETYAWSNDPPAGKDWSLYHPSCRKVWWARGLKPAVQDG
jgi:hypothetical protein